MTYGQWPQQHFSSLQRVLFPLFLILIGGLLWIAYARPFEAPTIPAPVFGRSSLSFIPNAGQSDPVVRYMAHMPGVGLYFTEEGLTFSASESEETEAAVMSWQFVGANPAEIKSTNPLPGVANYLRGSNSSEWLMGLPTFGNVQYEELYPGVNLAITGTPGRLATTIEVAPGANSEQVVWRFEGAEPTLNSETGALVLSDGNGRTLMEFERPFASQQLGGEIVPLIANYVIHGNGTIGVAAASTNKAQSLSLLLGVNLQTNMATDEAYGVVTNASFESFVTGITSSPLFPTVDPLQGTIANQYDTFITKFSADGDVLYSTYLGGNGRDYVGGIDLDPDGNIIVTGQTLSTDFPLANPIFGALADDRDAFVSKISANGSQLLFSSYIGGSNWDSANALDVDGQGNIYLVGHTLSTDYPLQNPIQNTSGGEYDAFLSKISGVTYQLVFSTYLGGSESDFAIGIDTDQSGNVFVTGGTDSADFPVINTGIPQPQAGMDIQNVFVTKFAADGSAILFSSLFGGSSDDGGLALSVDPLDNVYIAGRTSSSNFPVVNPIQSVKGGSRDAFITRVAGNGSSILFSTYLGGIHDDYATSIKVGGAGNVFVTGYTSSPDFPQLNPLPGMGYPGGTWDGFVLMHSPSGNLVWSTYLGGGSIDQANGVDVDSIGRPVVVGQTFSTDFPTANAFQPNLTQGSEAFVSRLTHAGNILEFSTYLGGGSYPGGPTEVNVSQIEGTAEPDLPLYLLALGLLAVCLLGLLLARTRLSK